MPQINGQPDATTTSKGKIQLAGVLNGTAAAPGLNLPVSAADANGWIKRDYGNWQTYERAITVTAQSVPANSNVSLGTFSLPVGVANSSTLRWNFSTFGGFGGRIFASGDNGNVNTAVTSLAIQLGNLTTSSISYTGFVYAYAITV